jgi:hypothetical protein
MDSQGDPMPLGFLLVPHAPVDIPEDPSALVDVPLETPALDLFMLGPIPLGVFDLVGESSCYCVRLLLITRPLMR